MKKQSFHNESSQRGYRRLISVVRALVGLGCGLSAAFAFAQAETSRNGLSISIPNGYAHINVDDMKLMSTAGPIRWSRYWNGKEWKFNPQWESLSQSWTNMTGSVTGTTDGGGAGATLGGGGGSMPPTDAASGCWVWVDEDWTPSASQVVVGGQPIGTQMAPERMTPFNRVMGEDQQGDYAPPRLVSVDYANLCHGTAVLSTPVRDVEALRLKNELYLGEGGRYAFSNRTVLEKRAVRALPEMAAAELDSRLAAGAITLAPIPVAKGYRWMDKTGEWIDYNTQGQVVAYGDKNDNTVWLARDTKGIVRGVVDANGRVVYTLHYTGELLAEVRDYPITGGARDLPARSVKYEYDAAGRLIAVIDVRGNSTRYAYDAANNIASLSDQEGRVETLVYAGSSVAKRTAPDGGVTDYQFNYDDVNKQFSSRVTGPETPAGRRVEAFTHNRSGKLIRRIVNGRIDEDVRYDSAARAETRTDARGFTNRMVFNEFDQMVQHDREDGTTIKYEYSALNLMLTAVIDAAGVKTKYERDAKGNLTRRVEAFDTPDVRVTEYEISSWGQISSVRMKGRIEKNGKVTPDAVTRLKYDSLGNVSQVIDPEGTIRHFKNNRIGKAIEITDPEGRAIKVEFDASGDLVKATDGIGDLIGYEYDKAGDVVKSISEDGKSTRYILDRMGRPVSIVSSIGGIEKIDYDLQGSIITMIDEDGRRTDIAYDNFQRVSQTVDRAGNIIRYTYHVDDGSASGMIGSLDGPTEIIYPTYSEKKRYDPLGRVTSTTLVDPIYGARNIFASYDSRGLLKSETDAYGKVSKYGFNAFGQPTELIDKLGNAQSFEFDARGNLRQVTDALGNVRHYEYDLNNRVIRETLPLGEISKITYDKSGNIATFTDQDNRKSAIFYDARNRVSKTDLFDKENNLISTTNYSWGANNKILRWGSENSGGSSSAEITYDENQRKTGETVHYPGGFAMSYTYAYSLAGKKTQLKWPDGTLIGYAYGAEGKLSEVTIPQEGIIKFDQFKWTSPTETLFPGGVIQYKKYDGLLNTLQSDSVGPNRESLLSVTNSYGALFEPIRITRADSDANLNLTADFTYDAANRLIRSTAEKGGGSQKTVDSYVLDAVGNRLSYSRTNGAWTYDANNRLIQRGTGDDFVRYQYDNSGNLVRKIEQGNRVTHYIYNESNRLAEVRTGENRLVAKYGYDPMGRRIWKDQYRNLQHEELPQAIRQFFLYADEGLIAEAEQFIRLMEDESTAVSGIPTIVTQYGPRPDATFSTGILFVKTRNSNGKQTFSYYHHDHRFAPIQATDRAGNIVWAATYDPYGRATVITPIATNEIPTIESKLRLPGQVEDPETGLHHNYYRDYDPDIGRYIQSDPIGLAGGINTYAYVSGNPLSYNDPFGLQTATIVDAGRIGLPTVGALCAGTGGAACAPAAIGIVGVGAYVITDKLVNPWAQPIISKAIEACGESWDKIQKDIDHTNYHNTCDRKPPENLTPCELARWDRRQAQSCFDKRTEWEERWGDSRSRGPHRRALENVKRRISNAVQDIIKFCPAGS